VAICFIAFVGVLVMLCAHDAFSLAQHYSAFVCIAEITVPWPAPQLLPCPPQAACRHCSDPLNAPAVL
jgi:hypothetical protein